MTVPHRSDHLTVYGLVGVAIHLVVGVLALASTAILPAGWMVAVGVLWLAGSASGIVLWRRTVWIPLLASLLVATVLMVGFLSNG